MKALIILLLFTGQLFAQERPAYPEILREYCENYQPEVYVDVPVKSANDYDLIYYIDPDYTGTSTGTIEQPLKSWVGISFQDNAAYLQKRGTETRLDRSRTIRNGVMLGAYGQGAKPIIIGDNLDSYYMFRFGGDNNIVRDLHFISSEEEGRHYHGVGSTYHSTSNLESRPDRNVIYNNTFLRTSITSWSTNLRVLNNSLYYHGSDAIFIQNSDMVELGNNNVIRPNQEYHDYDHVPNQDESHGDAIQLESVMDWYAYNNYMLKDDTGNKFVFIANGGDNGLAECNILVGPSHPGAGNTSFYFGGNQDNLVIQHNYIIGKAERAIYTHAALTFADFTGTSTYTSGW